MFWPAILVLIGLIALLVNTGVVPVDSLLRLADLWPLILIVAGLELFARRAFVGRSAEIAAIVIVVVAIAGAAAYVVASPSLPGGNQTLDATDTVGSLDHAQLELDVGGATVTIRGATDLGSDLFRAHINYRGPKPGVTLDRSAATLKISQSNGDFAFFSARTFKLDLQISSQVPWKIAMNSGAATDTLDLGSIDVRSIELNTGASHDEITLGPAHGEVPVSINGGAMTVRLHRPSTSETRVSVSGGAVNLEAENHHYGAIGEANWQSDGYARAADRYTVVVNGGACTVTVDRVATAGRMPQGVPGSA